MTEFPFAPQWHHLMAETRYATEQVLAGPRKLCTVPQDEFPDATWSVSYSETYPLHVGLHSYTSGLERLCKLTIVCHGYTATGTFPKVSQYLHRIGELLDTVGALDLTSIPTLHKPPPGELSLSDLDPDLTEMLVRFAAGAGRYEHLDSLSKGEAVVETVSAWTALSNEAGALPWQVHQLLGLRAAGLEAMRTLCTEGDLEAVGFALLDRIDEPLSRPSIAVVLDLYEKARWVASVLDVVTYQTAVELPMLGEALRELQQPAERFFQYSVAQIEDEDIAGEELKEHFKNHPRLDDEELENLLNDTSEDEGSQRRTNLWGDGEDIF